MKFKIGDRVTCKISVGEKVMANQKGTIIDRNADWGICIEFDNDVGGHDGMFGDTNGKQGHCWWVNNEGNLIKLNTNIWKGKKR